jgi:excisionase family DNA binding protein
LEGVAQMDSLMTLEEVAAYLRLSKDTVYRMAKAGAVPACKVGNQWRFRPVEVEAWLEDHRNAPGPARQRQPPKGRGR